MQDGLSWQDGLFLTRKTDLKLEASSTFIYFFFVLNNESWNDKLYDDEEVVQWQMERRDERTSQFFS